MAKKIIDIGSSPNKGDGDPLRTAFEKINENFDELYAGNFADPENTAASIIPSQDGAYDIGSADKQWADLYVKDFIYIGGVRLEASAGTILIGGDVVAREDTVGSVFGDDSTLLVDGVNSVIPWNVIDGAPTIPSFDQDLNTTDNVAFNTITTPNLVLDGDVTTLNELFIDGDAQAIGIKSQVSIVLDGDVTFQNGDLNVAGNIEIDGSFINNSVSDGSGLQVETTSDFEIKVDTAIWSFEPNDGGRIQFPDGSTQTTAYTGVIPGYINTADLKTLVAASTDFADFQTRIAAL